MSLLSYVELVDLVKSGVISPSDPDHINAASIDVRIGNALLVEPRQSAAELVNLRDREGLTTESVDMNAIGYYDLAPGEFILAHTIEIFNLPCDIAAEFKLKSSSARIGLNNALATWCDPGWHGSVLTLELTNTTRKHTIRLRSGDRIGQMLFYRVPPVPMGRDYAARGRYNGDRSVQAVKK